MRSLWLKEQTKVFFCSSFSRANKQTQVLQGAGTTCTSVQFVLLSSFTTETSIISFYVFFVSLPSEKERLPCVRFEPQANISSDERRWQILFSYLRLAECHFAYEIDDINKRPIFFTGKYYSWFRDWNISAKAQSPSKILFYHLAQTEMPLNDLPRIDKRESTFWSNEWMSEKKKKNSRQITEIFRHNKTRTYYIVFSPWIHLKIQCLVGVGANTRRHQATLWIPFNSEMPQDLNTEKTLVSSLGQTFRPEGGILWCRHDTNIKEMLLSAAEWVLGRQRKKTNSIWRQTPKSFKASRRESGSLRPTK